MTGPLRGLRVVELAGIGPAPFCAMVLADLGAHVLRLERPGSDPEWTSRMLKRGRSTAVIDLKQDGAADVMLSLLESADALVEGFRPGVMERLGLGPDICLGRNPQLVYGRMTGWGQEGPLASTAGHDLNYIAIAGALGAIGRPGELPVPPLNLIGDFGGGGLLLALGLLAAVFEAKRSGEGQIVDAAMIDGAALLMTGTYELLNAGLWCEERGVNLLDGGAPFYDVYSSADSKPVAVACLERRFYDELLQRLELPELAPLDHLERSSWPAIRAALRKAIGVRTSAQIDELFAGSNACITLVPGLSEAPRHPHNLARGTFYETPSGPLPSPAPRFSRTTADPPEPGSDDTRAALSRWGVEEVTIDQLAEAGIISLT